MKIAGVWSNHDCSYCILEDGVPVIHDEFERFLRKKEPKGDSVKLLFENYKNYDGITHVATCFPTKKLEKYPDSIRKLESIVSKNNGRVYALGHHQAHAANAFFSSNFDDAIILTIDGGGIEQYDKPTACTIWVGSKNKISHVYTFNFHDFNIGGIWTRVTRYVFGLQSGYPHGHQAGSVMAMAGFGNPERFYNDFYKMLTVDNPFAYHKPEGQKDGANIGEDPEHPYLEKYRQVAEESEQGRFDLAAGLQAATEKMFKDLLEDMIAQLGEFENLCLAGGVSLNSVMTGKIKEWIPCIENIYIPPCPSDGALSIGAAQYVWHHVLDNPRIKWKDNFTPYLGKKYNKREVKASIKKRIDEIDVSYDSSNDDLVDLLDNQMIVSVFGGGSESGKRALGNRSILADPRNAKMKETINEKVKHRQWYRPFAPSILREEVENWFDEDVDSPYMSFVLKFKEECQEKVPAVVHVDGSARLQTVTRKDNRWYHSFLKLWNKKSGVPIILNTSFNDREPICETPDHALDCFLRTNIDRLYFYDHGIMIKKK